MRTVSDVSFAMAVAGASAVGSHTSASAVIAAPRTQGEFPTPLALTSSGIAARALSPRDAMPSAAVTAIHGSSS